MSRREFGSAAFALIGVITPTRWTSPLGQRRREQRFEFKGTVKSVDRPNRSATIKSARQLSEAFMTDSNTHANPMKPPAAASTPVAHFYRVVWRWRFYAGLFVVPFLVMLSVTGIIYLFKPQLDRLMYRNLMYVSPQSQAAASEQLAAVRRVFPHARTRASFVTNFAGIFSAQFIRRHGQPGFHPRFGQREECAGWIHGDAAARCGRRLHPLRADR